ncbi:MAG TPA: hypothetical protein VD907_06585 [Verrucomicrobiae bacterium]|nr:hypothetical protein [Verrucomicrobiae bacterium]
MAKTVGSGKNWDAEFKQVLDRICEGESLRSIFRNNPPVKWKKFYDLINSDLNKAQQYAYAANVRAEMMFEEILSIADDSTNDVVLDEDGIPRVNNEVINRSRLRIDARKWMLGKMNPKKFSDKIINEHAGEDGKPIAHKHEVIFKHMNGND